MTTETNDFLDDEPRIYFAQELNGRRRLASIYKFTLTNSPLLGMHEMKDWLYELRVENLETTGGK